MFVLIAFSCRNKILIKKFVKSVNDCIFIADEKSFELLHQLVLRMTECMCREMPNSCLIPDALTT